MDQSERILDAAMRVYTRLGRQKATVQDVADEAGISKKTVYNHFRNKFDLFDQTISRKGMKVVQFYEGLLDEDDLPLPDKITKAVEFAFDEYKHKNESLHRDMNKTVNPYLGDYPVQFVQRNIAESIRTLFSQAQDEGLCRTDYSAEVLTAVILSMVSGVMAIDDHPGDANIPGNFPATAIHLLLQAVLTEKGRRALPNLAMLS